MKLSYIPDETSLIRQTALDLLEQAYQTDPLQTLSRERANRLEALIARHLGGSMENFNKVRSGPLLDRYIKLIIESGLHLSLETWTGFCSGQLNRLLRGTDLPLDLPNWGQEQFFPELTFNSSLSQEERSACLNRVEREREALKRAFHWVINQGEFEPRFFGPDELFLNYYEQVCLEKASPPDKRPPHSQLFVDLGSKGIHIFKMPTRQLIESSLNGINPSTGHAYSSDTLRRIRGRFQIELKLLKAERSIDLQGDDGM